MQLKCGRCGHYNHQICKTNYCSRKVCYNKDQYREGSLMLLQQLKLWSLLVVAVAYVKIIQKTNFGMFRLFLVSWQQYFIEPNMLQSCQQPLLPSLLDPPAVNTFLIPYLFWGVYICIILKPTIYYTIPSTQVGPGLCYTMHVAAREVQ